MTRRARGSAEAALRAVAGVVRRATWLSAVGLLTALLNLAFYVVVARATTPSAYGAVAALLLVVTVAMFLAAGTEYTVSRITVLHAGSAGELLRRALPAVWPWLALATAVGVLSGPVAAYLNLDSALPVALAAVLFGVIMLNACATGVLAGRGRYLVISLLQLGTATLRVGAGAWLARGSAPVAGALSAALLAVGVGGAAAVVLAGLAAPLAQPARRVSREQLKSVAGDGVSGAFLAACLWAVWGFPLVFARHGLEAAAAGSLAAAQLMAGALVWASAVVIRAFFPVAVRRPSVVVVLLGGAVTVAVCAAGGAVLVLAGPWLAPRVFGAGFAADAGVFTALAGSASAVSLVTYGLWMSRALRRYVFMVTMCITVAVPVELMVGSVRGASAFDLALGPALSIGLGVTLAAVASAFTARRLPRPGGVVVEALAPAVLAAMEERG